MANQDSALDIDAVADQIFHTDPVEPLRSKPRQQRSERSIDEILDAAVRVASSVGVEQLTTVLVAKEAGVSVGRVYYWFEDKAALVDAARTRLQDQFVGFFTDQIKDVDSSDATDLVASHARTVLMFFVEQPAALDLLDVDRTSSGTNELRALMADIIEMLLVARVEGIEPAECALVSRTLVSMLLALAGDMVVAPPDQHDVMVDEAVYAMFSYIHSRYPHEDDPVWDDPENPVQPARAVKIEGGRSRPIFPPVP